MATGQPSPLLRHLSRAVLLQAGATDAQLLESFLAQRDEAAFRALVLRHGPMVLGVCRRILKNEADAEDAFQATFLVFVHKAASIARPAQVGNWLYGVAHKTALKARAIKSRRRASEQRAGSNRPLESPGEQDQEPRALLDEELGRLPDRYRVPIVLCELEGMSLKDTARLLGCPLGTVASRLARARRLLARRLTRRGLRLSAGAVALVLSQEAFARLPAPLVVSTTEAVSSLAAGRAVAAGAVSANVTALAEGVLKAMFLTRLRIVVGMLFLLAVLGLCVGGLAYPTQAAGPGRQEEAQQRDVGPKWEYKALTRHNIEKLARKDSTDRLSDGLNVLGRDGWELAAVDLSVYFPQESSLSSGGSLSTYLFKRPR